MRAYDLSTANLNPVCSQIADGNENEDFIQGLCIGIIFGVEDDAHYENKICIPTEISIKERALVIRNYVISQPERMDETFASLVFDALAQKWPCSPKKI